MPYVLLIIYFGEFNSPPSAWKHWLLLCLTWIALLLCSSQQWPVRGNVSSHLTDKFQLSELFLFFFALSPSLSLCISMSLALSPWILIKSRRAKIFGLTKTMGPQIWLWKIIMASLLSTYGESFSPDDKLILYINLEFHWSRKRCQSRDIWACRSGQSGLRVVDSSPKLSNLHRHTWKLVCLNFSPAHEYNCTNEGSL